MKQKMCKSCKNPVVNPDCEDAEYCLGCGPAVPSLYEVTTIGDIQLPHLTQPISGIKLISDERIRQVGQELWTSEHDDAHVNCELAQAAVCYIQQSIGRRWLDPISYQKDIPPVDWPWDQSWWKPKHPIRDLVRAAALIAAEIDRLQRLELGATTPSTAQ